MAEFKVDTERLRGQAEALESLRSSLNDVALKLSGMQLGSILQIKASTALFGKITDCKWAAIHQSGDIGQLARGLDNVADTYDNVEKNLLEPKTEAQAKSEAKAEESDWIQNLVKIFGGSSAIASFFAAYYYSQRGITGTLGDKSVVDMLKCLVKGAGTVGKCALNGDSKAEWAQSLLGLKKAGDGMDATGISDFLQKEIGNYDFSGAEKLGDKIKVGAKWAGAALTIAGSAVSNYDEFNGDLSNARFWEETALESGLDIAKGIAVTAAVSACFAGAPVVVVAAIGTGVTVAVDWVSKQVFNGRGVTEVVSDAILDVVHGNTEGLRETANQWLDSGRNLIKKAKDGVRTAWDSISSIWRQPSLAGGGGGR